MIKLVCYSEDGAEKTRVFNTEEVLLGRFNPTSADETIPAQAILNLYPDRRVSRPHARIFLKGNRCWVEDLGSTNGTILNGKRLRREKAVVAYGDELLVGDTRILATFELPEGKEEATTEYDDSTSAPREKPRLDVAAQLERLELLDKLLSQSTGQQQVLDIALPMLKEFFPNSRQTIALLQREELVAHAFWPRDKSYLDFKLADNVLKSGEAIFEKTAICAPMADNRGPFGVIYVDTVQPGKKYSREEGQMLKRIAWTVAQGLKKHDEATLDPLPSAFISYVREDREWVNQLAGDLRRRRVKVWYDARMIVGAHWSREIQTALESCEAFVVVLTPLSVTSPWVMAELNRALELDKVIIPLIYQNCPYPVELETIQRVNIGRDYEAGLEQIMARLSRLNLAPSPAPAPAPVKASLPATAPLPAVDEPGTVHNNLGTELSWSIGREKEIAALKGRLPDQKTRLLTLTGPGGVGKTHLAIKVAQELASSFSNGVCLVELAAATTPEQAARKIAEALKLPVSSDERLAELLKNYLWDKNLLLLLDNFEQTGAASLVAELLEGAPALKALVTSRTALNLRGEQEFVVPPLALPDLKQLPWPEQVSQFAALQLFTRRAEEVKPEFTFDPKYAADSALICIRLDGLPLAIELVAARFDHFQTPGALLNNLAGSAELAPKRGSGRLETTLEWSYKLLNEAEQGLFRKLAVFAGSWDEAAARAICLEGNRPESELTDSITALLNDNLLRLAPGNIAGLRFRMLETVRRFALKRLQENPAEMNRLYPAFAAYWLARVEEAEAELQGPKPAEALNRLDREYDNFRVALAWSLEGQELETGLKLAIALNRYWLLRGYLKEGQEWLEKGLQAVEAAGIFDDGLNARAYHALGKLNQARQKYGEAAQWLDKALQIQQNLPDIAALAETHGTCGNVALEQGEYASAQAHLRQSLQLLQQANLLREITLGLNYLSGLAAAEGHDERAALLAGAAHNLREANGIPLAGTERALFQRRLQPALLRLGPEGWRALFQEGSKLSLKEALAYALEGRSVQ